ncbi:NAD(P)H-hydrate dehydratase [Occallatibacter riparius]|uniref:Bifunctional NAD(P)H-hydrate repair enzyme n=1 Tax=Occallatibacter riparius TaxID=1002689 RepID=A0A9J7BV44_9BACT|nr:NAD(P)H-hydrate dehydratase [Occallatibacter riparius]UWZ86747.1 NAD(P)H-hydrate dehydratase [Occallatibacter riparius]
MKILSAAEMQACDRATTESFGIPSFDLMRHAAAAVATFARERFAKARRITVLCGRGNNGGDGMMAARLLGGHGLHVTVMLLGSPDGLAGDAAEAWRRLGDAGNCRLVVVETEEQLQDHQAAFRADLIIDAVLGTGFKPPMRGLALAALQWVRDSDAPVLAVDLPSGWAADEMKGDGDEQVYPADGVVTFTAPKPAHVFGELTRRWNQPVVVAPIGSPDEAMASSLDLYWAGTAQEIVQTPRPFDSNKGKYGHVLVIGGTFGSAGGKAGAPAMTAMAAMRAGAGLVTAAVPEPALPTVARFAPELMTVPLETNGLGEAQLSADEEKRQALLKGMTVAAVGPGLGQGSGAEAILEWLLNETIPLVIDADGLNVLAKSMELLGGVGGAGRTIVLTPHPGEMARLAGISTAEVQSDRLNVARDFAARYGVILVLKGAHTLIAHPSGRVAVNTTGNPGMAKGGSGDLLTGVIAGLLAQFPSDPERAVEAAVYIHGLAADFAVRAGDEHTLLATDTLSYFSNAFRFRSTRRNGYVWLQGLPADLTAAKSSSEAAE